MTLATRLSCSALRRLAQLWFLCFFPSTSAYPGCWLLLSPVALAIPQSCCAWQQPQKKVIRIPMWHFSMSQLLSNRIFTTQCSLPYSRKTAETGFWQKRMQNAFTVLWGINKNKDKHKTACGRRELVKPSWSAASWGSVQIHWYPTHAHTAGASLQCSGSSAAWGHAVAVK